MAKQRRALVGEANLFLEAFAGALADMGPVGLTGRCDGGCGRWTAYGELCGECQGGAFGVALDRMAANDGLPPEVAGWVVSKVGKLAPRSSAGSVSVRSGSREHGHVGVAADVGGKE